MIHYERLMIHYEHLMIHYERFKSGQEGLPRQKKKVLRDAGTQRPKKELNFQKKSPKNMKSGLNRVARPRFGPILSGNVAVDPLMLLVAPEPPKTL